MSIRNAEIKDAKSIADLAQDCSGFMRSSVEGTYEYLIRCFRSTFLVYEDKEEIKGFVVSFPNIDIEGEYWIYQICINGSLRGKGIGYKLLSPLIKIIQEKGYKILKTHANNQHSYNLHKKCGFKPYEDDGSGWFMELKLS